MKREALMFERPAALAATQPSETRGIARDDVRLLVSSPAGHQHAVFRDLTTHLREGDLLVINRSGTLPASLPAQSHIGDFTLNLSTNYGNGMWLAEPRWSPDEPGPLPLQAGDTICIDNIAGRLIAPFPGLSRLWFIQFASKLDHAMAHVGRPIRYHYLDANYPLSA